jgi:succinate dehydrogenase/fumarate reductase cytochrome b subunit
MRMFHWQAAGMAAGFAFVAALREQTQTEWFDVLLFPLAAAVLFGVVFGVTITAWKRLRGLG